MKEGVAQHVVHTVYPNAPPAISIATCTIKQRGKGGMGRSSARTHAKAAAVRAVQTKGVSVHGATAVVVRCTVAYLLRANSSKKPRDRNV